MIVHQYKIYKDLKQNIEDQVEVLFHIDFSENYGSKCSEEVQPMHFGASRKQISLHTGVLYFRQNGEMKKHSFATISSNLDHEAYAIMAHMEPVFDWTRSIVSKEIEIIHFWSDGPASQYRNNYNIHYMAEKLPKQFPQLQCWFWNYSIAGHGKGPADGVGAVLKRSADTYMAHGNVSSFEELFTVAQKLAKGIFI